MDKIIKRDGNVMAYDGDKITKAIVKAIMYDANGEPRGGASLSQSDSEAAKSITAQITDHLTKNCARHGVSAVHIEDVQDAVELFLMRSGMHEVARDYVIYRANHAAKRKITVPEVENFMMTRADGSTVPLDVKAIIRRVENACRGFDGVSVEKIVKEATRNMYNGVAEKEVAKAILLSARTYIETDPQYDKVAANLLLDDIVLEATGKRVEKIDYATHLTVAIERGVRTERLDERLLTEFDLGFLGAAIVGDRDRTFSLVGLQTLYDRYFLHENETRYELPQTMWMRIAMGLALNEGDRKNEWARAFYDVLSQKDFTNSTPTLFNSGTTRSQLASCFLTTVSDDLDGIYDNIKENAHLQKYAGGLGNDWTPVRALGSWIKGTNGKSQGVVPFLKVVNDTAVAVNQGGKRKGAVCAYLETWHLDIEEFLELRKNTGDDRRRTHDMNTANWIPDMFMKRVAQKGMWTLLSPSDVPHLHDLFGKAFEVAYLEAERKTETGEITNFKQIPALDLWRKMLSMLFETGHPWITFKDPCNIRSPQQHVGVVHSSNLCTEITLNTSAEESAVCNIGSISLPAHMRLNTTTGKWEIDLAKLEKTIRIAMRMLDNVIDINHYASEKARTSNLRHRPVGLGMMGFQDVLQLMRIPFASQEAVDFADESMEAICYFAYKSSMEMAKERGTYSSFKGSLWDQGILPHDSQKLLQEARGTEYLDIDMSSRLGFDKWDALRADIKRFGMRNSNCVAIAPTATISNIIDVSACIEPTFKNLFVKSNLSGEFTIINKYLVRDLKDLGLWDEVMIADLKHYDGDVSQITRIPQEVRDLYATAFDIHPKWGIYQTSRRQKWIDQAVSHNVYMKGASGKMLNETYMLAWTKGLKTTYYLRTMGATAAEKSTGRGGELNAVQSTPASAPVAAPVVEAAPQQRMEDKLAATAPAAPAMSEDDIVGAACFLRPGDEGFEECEACQ